MKDMINKIITGFLSIINRQSSIVKNKKGFTLIELAIVMVIIGLILGAVMKGQDLIQGARTKKFVSGVNSWTSIAWTFVDRKGRFPGDFDTNGIIGDNASSDPKTDLEGASFAAKPSSPLTLGGNTFYLFLGNDGTTARRNILLLCPKKDCATAMSTGELLFADALDTTIDGTAVGTTGQVRCTATTPTAIDDTKWLVGGGSPTDISTAVTCDTSAKGIMFYFDRAP
tara:strand:- start:219 stop:899 length:681 start_codon:yes stop_codon:yes gene_type:complete